MAIITLPTGSFGDYVNTLLTSGDMQYVQNLLTFLNTPSTAIVTFVPSGIVDGQQAVSVAIDGKVTSYGLPLPRPITTSPAPTPVPTPTPVTTPQPTTVSLSNIITINSSSIDRNYIQGTLQPISPANIFVTNTSPTFSVQVAFTTTTGITFDPVSFVLTPLSSRNVNISFDPTVINNLPVGSNTITTLINLYSNPITSASV